MKSVKKIMAVVIAVLLIMAVSGIALAATSKAPAQNLVSDNQYTINKDIVVFNTDGEQIYEPNIAYTYTVSSVAVQSPAQSVTDINSNTANIKSGVANGLLLKVNAADTPASSATITFGDTDVLVNTNTEALDSTITDSSAKVSRSFTAVVNPSVFGTMPGIYRYKITESSSDYTVSGVDKGSFTDDRYIDVYIRWNQAGTALECYGMTMFTADNSIIYSETPDAGFKVTGYNVDSEDIDVDSYHTYNINVSKNVAGSLGDVNNEFPFYVSIAANGATAADFRATSGSSDAPSGILKFTNGTYTLNPNYATTGTDLTMKKGDNVKFVGLPYPATATVKELDNTVDVYTASATETSTGSSATLVINDTSATTGAKTWETADGAITPGSGSTLNTNDVVLTNTLSEVSPTGIVMRVAPYALMVAAGIALLIVTRRRRQHA